MLTSQILLQMWTLANTRDDTNLEGRAESVKKTDFLVTSSVAKSKTCSHDQKYC